jgi:protein-S-isoprenylcysteine O-methyltransferase Ste14
MDQSTELMFRISIGALAAVYFLERQFFIRKFAALAKTHSRHERPAVRGFHLVYAANFFVLLYVFTRWTDFSHIDLPLPLRWFGGFVMVAALALYAWTHHTLGSLWTSVLEISANHELKTDGPYRFVRHPMYSAFFLYAIGVLLLSANALVSGILLAATWWMYSNRVDAEEQMMLDQFGDQYRDYMSRIGRLLPRFVR